MEELLQWFKKNGIAIQLTFDLGKLPTVHAITKEGLKFTVGETIVEALENMKEIVEGL